MYRFHIFLLNCKEVYKKKLSHKNIIQKNQNPDCIAKKTFKKKISISVPEK